MRLHLECRALVDLEPVAKNLRERRARPLGAVHLGKKTKPSRVDAEERDSVRRGDPRGPQQRAVAADRHEQHRIGDVRAIRGEAETAILLLAERDRKTRVADRFGDARGRSPRAFAPEIDVDRDHARDRRRVHQVGRSPSARSSAASSKATPPARTSMKNSTFPAGPTSGLGTSATGTRPKPKTAARTSRKIAA